MNTSLNKNYSKVINFKQNLHQPILNNFSSLTHLPHFSPILHLFLPPIIPPSSAASSNFHAKRLYKDLLVESAYNKNIRPVDNYNDVLPVALSLKLLQLIDVVSGLRDREVGEDVEVGLVKEVV